MIKSDEILTNASFYLEIDFIFSKESFFIECVFDTSYEDENYSYISYFFVDNDNFEYNIDKIEEYFCDNNFDVHKLVPMDSQMEYVIKVPNSKILEYSKLYEKIKKAKKYNLFYIS